MIYQQVQFDCDDINDDKYLHEGACVQFLLDDKLATNITPFPEVTIVTFLYNNYILIGWALFRSDHKSSQSEGSKVIMQYDVYTSCRKMVNC